MTQSLAVPSLSRPQSPFSPSGHPENWPPVPGLSKVSYQDTGKAAQSAAATVVCYRGAPLMKIRALQPPSRRQPGHRRPRGPVGDWNARMVGRLRQSLAKLRSDVLSGACAIDLTFPGEYPDPQTAADMRREFERRLLRRWPQAYCHHVREFQQRGASHFHLLVCGVAGPLALLRPWVAETWYAVVGSGDERHRRAGTRVQPVRSARGMVSYLAGCLPKGEQKRAPEGTTPGRWWGVAGQGNAWRYEGTPIDRPLTAPQLAKLVRTLDGLQLAAARGRQRWGAVSRIRRQRGWRNKVSSWWLMETAAALRLCRYAVNG